MSRVVAAVAVVAVALAACGGGTDDGDRAQGGGTAGVSAAPDDGEGRTAGGDDSGTGGSAGGDQATGREGAVTAAELCARARPVAPAPAVATVELDETSGVVASRDHPGVLWAHDDSGGPAAVVAIGPDGADLGTYPLDGAEATDWEDVALAPGPDGAADLLVVGDIGDNGAGRDHVTLVVAPEPTPAPPAAPAPGTGAGAGAGARATSVAVTGATSVNVTYADGPRDAEALLADPRTGDVVIVDKDWNGTGTGAWLVPAVATGTEPPRTPASADAEGAADDTAGGGGASVMAERVGDVALPAGQPATGGDVSPDGSLVALRTYTSVLLWDRPPGSTVAEALAAGPPCTAPSARENQGEAVAFTRDGRGYVTISEGAHPAINRFALR